MNYANTTAPLPIFNKNKRPRQALVAHPNNAPGHHSQSAAGHSVQQRNYHQIYRQSSNTSATPYTHSYSSQ